MNPAIIDPTSGPQRRHLSVVHPDPSEQRRVAELLGKASRTFAITIPMLPQPLRHAMGVAYLLMRNADTLEDAAEHSRERRITMLTRFSILMRGGDPSTVQAFVEAASDFDAEPDYFEVLEATPFLMEQLAAMPQATERVIREHVERVAGHMAFWVGRHDPEGCLQLDRVRELEDYCYGVAGIVGEMITDLVSLYDPSLDRRRVLSMHANAVDFGIGLQLTNVLKDSWRDAQQGRRYLPARFVRFDGTDRPGSLRPLVEMAMHRLDRGLEYTAAIPYDHAGIRNFCLVALVLAAASLAAVRDREDEVLAGTDVKIDRATLASLVSEVADVVGSNDRMRELWAQLRAPGLAGTPPSLPAVLPSVG